MKRLLGSLVLLATWYGLSFGQSALIDVPLTLGDGVSTRTLRFGLDQTATDGIDAALGESELPPLPPAGVLDARFIGADIGISLGLGLAKDYREGDLNTSGARIHELQYQVGSGTSITISWNLPSWATGRLQDLVTGSIIDVQMNESGSYQVPNPGVINKLKMTITYTAPLPIQLLSFTATPIGSGHVLLDWATMSEVNNLGFHIQRRHLTESVFVYLTGIMIPGHGTTLVPQYYSYTDNIGIAGEYEYRLVQIDLDGAMHYSDAVGVDVTTSALNEEQTPKYFSLSQNYPNPFNPSTTIKYGLPNSSVVRLSVYDMLSREVSVLVNEGRDAGFHEVKLDGSNLASGVYFYRLQAGDFVQAKRLVILK